MRRSRTWAALAAFLLVLAATLIERVPEVLPGTTPVSDHDRILRLYEEQRSGEMVEGVGIVDRVLRDDTEGSQHQRFIMRLDSGQTLLVSHNIDLAPRVVGLGPGDEVEFRGQYEWNERGGVLHWTHHDPDGDRPGGWLRRDGITYR